jgi:hypothetical protein
MATAELRQDQSTTWDIAIFVGFVVLALGLAWRFLAWNASGPPRPLPTSTYSAEDFFK